MLLLRAAARARNAGHQGPIQVWPAAGRDMPQTAKGSLLTVQEASQALQVLALGIWSSAGRRADDKQCGMKRQH